MFNPNYPQDYYDQPTKRRYYRPYHLEDATPEEGEKAVPEPNLFKVFAWTVVLGVLLTLVVHCMPVAKLLFEHRADHGSNLPVFLMNTREEPHEYWAAFNRQGGKIAEYTDHDENSVGLPNAVYSYADFFGATTTAHNHPHYDITFSAADICTFINGVNFCGIERTVVGSPNYTTACK